MGKTNIRLGKGKSRSEDAALSTPAGSGMDEAVEDILFGPPSGEHPAKEKDSQSDGRKSPNTQ